MDFMLAVKATAAGAVLGAVFQKLRLPLPAPPVLAGVMGILGILIGNKLVNLFF